MDRPNNNKSLLQAQNEEPIRTNQMEMITYKDMETEIESKDICPVCQKHAEGDTIECEECDDWLHFECVGLTKAQVHKIDSDIPYICKQCIDDHLYQLPKDIDETIVLETKQKNNEQEPNQIDIPQSARVFPSYAGPTNGTENHTNDMNRTIKRVSDTTNTSPQAEQMCNKQVPTQ